MSFPTDNSPSLREQVDLAFVTADENRFQFHVKEMIHQIKLGLITEEYEMNFPELRIADDIHSRFGQAGFQVHRAMKENRYSVSVPLPTLKSEWVPPIAHRSKILQNILKAHLDAIEECFIGHTKAMISGIRNGTYTSHYVMRFPSKMRAEAIGVRFTRNGFHLHYTKQNDHVCVVIQLHREEKSTYSGYTYPFTPDAFVPAPVSASAPTSSHANKSFYQPQSVPMGFQPSPHTAYPATTPIGPALTSTPASLRSVSLRESSVAPIPSPAVRGHSHKPILRRPVSELVLEAHNAAILEEMPFSFDNVQCETPEPVWT